MRMACDYHMEHADQTESMSCEDCNRCINCGHVYFDEELEECPNCDDELIK